MTDERWEEIVENNKMINEILVKLVERVEHIEKYVQTMPTPDKVMYRPPNHEDYLNIKENYDLLYKRLEALENGMQKT
tara:strand:- start:3629 stop:3862 length:234 start_codon:yes stop_codon:yes gene_type:complete